MIRCYRKRLIHLFLNSRADPLVDPLVSYPRKHPDFGDMPPSVDRIAAALAEKDNLKIQPSGAYAANLLGLSDQVPAKIVFLTDGSSRMVQIGNWNIKLKKTDRKST